MIVIPIIVLGTIPKDIEKTREEDQWKNRNYPDCSITKIGLDIQESPEDVRRLTITQTSVKTIRANVEKTMIIIIIDLARELKRKLWNMKVMVTLIVIGELGTIPKGLVKGLEDLEIRGQDQITALLRLARTLRRVLET